MADAPAEPVEEAGTAPTSGAEQSVPAAGAGIPDRVEAGADSPAGSDGATLPSAGAMLPVPAAEQPPAEERLTLGPPPGPILVADLVATAGRKAMWVHLDRMLLREPGVSDPERPDDLRKYRVAIRRLRAALRLFGPAFPNGDTRPLRRGLSDLAAVVGTIRDLDNRLADLDRWATEHGGGATAGVAPLAQAWARDRQRAMASLAGRLESRRHARLLAALVAFVDIAPPGARRARGERPYTVHDRIASLLWTAYEDVRAFAPVLRWADLETIHDLRIATKRLRDDLDFLADVLPPDRAWLAERLVALQDHLGALNDATVTVAAVRAFLEHWVASPGEQAYIGAYLTDKERSVAQLRRAIWRPWRPVVGIGFARKLARTVVAGPATATSQASPAS